MPSFTPTLLNVLHNTHTHTHTAPIQHIQNQAIRIMTYSPYNSNAAQLLKANRLLTIRNLFKYSLSILMYQSVNKLIPTIIFPPETLANNNCTRFASNNNFLLPKVNTNYGKHSAYFAAISTWNGLPSEIKTRSFINSFKTALFTFLHDA